MNDDLRKNHAPSGHPAQRPMPQYRPRPIVHPANTNSFRTPEQIAKDETENKIDMSAPDSGAHIGKDGKPKKHRRSLKEWLKTRTKKQWAIIIIIAVLVLAGIGTGTYFLFFHKNAPVKTVTKAKVKKVAPKPTTVPSKLTGLPVDPTVNDRTVTAVMIENSMDSRPQSGIDQAGVVFEAIAEGGITRFCAIFQDTAPAYIGPVRSVRPYYIQWAMGFDAAIAHVGGSAQALQDMKNLGVKDLDQFANGAYYQRISSRYAPHNVYTSMAKLNELEGKKGYGAGVYTSLVRKKEQPSKTPNAKSIDVRVSSTLFNSHYDYDATTNTYKRSEGGAPHMVVDEAGNQTQIAPKVVAVLTMSQGLADDTHMAYGTIGTGHAFIFQDGTVYEGNWKKTGNKENFTFTDNTDKTISLNPGQTWITAVGDTSYVSYQ